MSNIKVMVNAGICGMNTEILAKPNDDGMIELDITSDCGAVKKAAKALEVVDPMEVITRGLIDNAIYVGCAGCIAHAACPIPCAMVKAVEIASDMALKKDVDFKFEKI